MQGNVVIGASHCIGDRIDYCSRVWTTKEISTMTAGWHEFWWCTPECGISSCTNTTLLYIVTLTATTEPQESTTFTLLVTNPLMGKCAKHTRMEVYGSITGRTTKASRKGIYLWCTTIFWITKVHVWSWTNKASLVYTSNCKVYCRVLARSIIYICMKLIVWWTLLSTAVMSIELVVSIDGIVHCGCNVTNSW